MLPEKFSSLENHLGWALPTETERSEKRRNSSFAELQAYYDAMVPHLPEALAYLNTIPLHSMHSPERRLLDLCLSFAEIAPFVEQYKRVTVPDNFDERRFVPIHDRLSRRQP